MEKKKFKYIKHETQYSLLALQWRVYKDLRAVKPKLQDSRHWLRRNKTLEDGILF